MSRPKITENLHIDDVFRHLVHVPGSRYFVAKRVDSTLQPQEIGAGRFKGPTNTMPEHIWIPDSVEIAVLGNGTVELHPCELLCSCKTKSTAHLPKESLVRIRMPF